MIGTPLQFISGMQFTIFLYSYFEKDCQKKSARDNPEK